MRVFRHRLSLLGKFSLLSLVLIVALGAVLATKLEWQIERRALENAEELARVTAQVGVARHLVSRDFGEPCRRCGCPRSTPSCAIPGSRRSASSG